MWHFELARIHADTGVWPRPWEWHKLRMPIADVMFVTIEPKESTVMMIARNGTFLRQLTKEYRLWYCWLDEGTGVVTLYGGPESRLQSAAEAVQMRGSLIAIMMDDPRRLFWELWGDDEIRAAFLTSVHEPFFWTSYLDICQTAVNVTRLMGDPHDEANGMEAFILARTCELAALTPSHVWAFDRTPLIDCKSS
jgi:hypothetical protein